MDELDARPGLEVPDVVTKYKMGAEMANKVVKTLAEACVAGAKVYDLCIQGDQLIEQETGSVFNKKVDKKPVPKGIAFPTCISVNNVLFHCAPMEDDEPIVLADGDLVKIDMGLHLDGYISVCGHSMIVGATAEKPAEGPKAEALLAAYKACHAAARLIKPGNKSDQVNEAVNSIASDYGCTVVEDVASYQMSQFEMMDEKSLIFKPSEQQRSQVKTVEFEDHEVYAVDVLVSTGDGKAKLGSEKATIYKPTGSIYQLKMKQSRQTFAEVQQRFGTMAFHLRSFENTARASFGLKECVEHQIVQPFEMMQTNKGDYVAQFRFTVLLMPKGNLKITGLDLDEACYKTDKTVADEALVKLLSQPLSAKSSKKKNKKKKKTNGDDSAAAASASAAADK
eukprot:TRINITY_DN8121_c0_g1_i4.p1 TRINITY_DN8121_c0_g1~~TRINITY_DN8121_c0_g1_i4.p1  ORF type:complete len:419 (+),score=134.90 TRINITY_DN8121_c0_g1_i4:73-1257(+)